MQFKHGETNQVIKIPIIDDMEFEKDENFEIELYEPEGGAKLGKINRTAVTITNDDEFNSVLNKMLLMTNANVDSMKVHHETWAQQLKDAMNVNGGDVENASTVIPSKVFFFNMSFPNNLSPFPIGRLHHALPNLWFQGTIAFLVKLALSSFNHCLTFADHFRVNPACWYRRRMALFFRLPRNDRAFNGRRGGPGCHFWMSCWPQK